MASENIRLHLLHLHLCVIVIMITAKWLKNRATPATFITFFMAVGNSLSSVSAVK